MRLQAKGICGFGRFGGLAGVVLLGLAASVLGQGGTSGGGRTGGGGGASGSSGGLGGSSGSGGLGGSSGGFSGGSGGGFSGGSSGGFSGGSGGGFSGGSGGGFSGGSGGSSGGSGSGFSGGTQNQTAGTTYGGFLGTLNMASGGRTAGSTGVATSNPFRATYGNPFSVGIPGGTGRVTFGQALYTQTGTTGITGTTGMLGTNTNLRSGTFQGGTAGVLSRPTGGVGQTTNVPFASSIGVRRAPQYVTVLGDDFVRPAATSIAPAAVRADLQDVLSRSARLANPGSIQIVMDGGTVVLRGTVDRESDKRHAEGLIRLSPGIREVRNEIQVKSSP